MVCDLRLWDFGIRFRVSGFSWLGPAVGASCHRYKIQELRTFALRMADPKPQTLKPKP